MSERATYFECGRCSVQGKTPMRFKKKERLEEHIEEEHRGNTGEAYQCAVCHEGFDDFSSLEDHAETAHIGEDEEAINFESIDPVSSDLADRLEEEVEQMEEVTEDKLKDIHGVGNILAGKIKNFIEERGGDESGGEKSDNDWNEA